MEKEQFEELLDNLLSEQQGFDIALVRHSDTISAFLKLQEAKTALLAAWDEANEWIPVSERMPEQGKRVEVVINGTVSIAKYWAQTPQWETIDGLFYHGDEFAWVTHWKPLPEPPNEAQP